MSNASGASVCMRKAISADWMLASSCGSPPFCSRCIRFNFASRSSSWRCLSSRQAWIANVLDQLLRILLAERMYVPW